MPVNLVNLQGVRKAYGTRVLLDDVSLGVAAGERVGVVGRNGGGKTTLVRVLAGEEPPDAGRVTRTGGLRVGVLAQSDVLDPAHDVRRAVVGGRAEHEWAGDARIRSVLAALLGGLALDRPVTALSGGERRRVALAALLVEDPELLVLDEPTNHLDVEVIGWLARHLRERRGALLVVTHDRWFLDEVAERVWELVGGRVEQYDGGYGAYVLAKAERARQSDAEESRRQNLLRKELAWLRRGAPARTSKPRYRVEAANALVAGEPPARDRLELERFAAARLGNDVLDLEDADVSAGPVPVLRRATWRLGPGDRVGLVGPNGSGKTTLLRTLAGELAPRSGRLRTGQTVRLAHLSQQVTELDPAVRLLESVEQVARVVDLGRGRTATATQLLERFGFSGDAPWAPVGDLSGGERRRLQVLRLLMGEPNVLLLDEPTNDLDIEVLQVVEDVLDGWPGTLVVVSHDRWFLERVCDTVLALAGDGMLRHLPRGVEEYLELRSAASGGAAAAAWADRHPGASTGRASGAPTGAASGAATGASRGGATGAPTGGAPSAAATARAGRKELARLERRLERIAAEEVELHAAMAEQATDFTAVAALDTRLRELLVERAELEDRWLEVADP